MVRMNRINQKQMLMESKYTFNFTRPTALVIGNETPAKQFKEMVPTIMIITANIMVFDDQASKKISSQQGHERSSTFSEPRLIVLPLTLVPMS
ncbi:MAG: hypothetical protein ACUVWV_02390 [Thermodesulfobacteriota bacterium]